MKVEIHLIHTVPAANLNRDDTGYPKTVTFGGVPRIRLSSQAQKKAVRDSLRGSLDPQLVAIRTRRLARALERFLDLDPNDLELLPSVLRALGVGLTDRGISDYLYYLAPDQIRSLATLLRDHWSGLVALAKKSDGKKKRSAEVPVELRSAVDRVLRQGKAVDMALFGRMMADRPVANIDAAAHVMHAHSTHAGLIESDFFVATDDLALPGEAASGMLGESGFYSATFYRYAAVDLETLINNLDGDNALAQRALGAFLKAFATTLPGGKQSSHAAYTLPEAALIVAHAGQPRNLSGAFDRPVTAREGGFAAPSARALLRYWRDLDAMYGPQPERYAAWVSLASLGVSLEEGPGIETAPGFPEAVGRIVNHAFDNSG